VIFLKDKINDLQIISTLDIQPAGGLMFPRAELMSF
jgi:hypothetical protein